MKKIIFILTIVFVLAGCFDKNIDKLNNLKRVYVTDVSITESSVSIFVGETIILKAILSPSNATNNKLSWSSSDMSIVAVDETGKLTALAEGMARINVETADGGKTATCIVEVKAGVVLDKDNTLKSLTIDANGATIPITPAFSTGIITYSAIVENGVTSISISVATNSVKAKVQGIGSKPLMIGDNKEYIVVTAEDGSTKSYCLVVTRKDAVVATDIGKMILVLAGTTSANNGSITVENDFYIGKYEVTQSEFQSVMGFNPSYFTGTNVGNNPVEQVTWYDAVAYCNAKSAAEGLGLYYNISGITKIGNNITAATVTENIGAKGYRLPTEVEWEYAARGGKNGVDYTYSGSNAIEDVAWYSSNSRNTTHPVGGKAANYLGIYDMSGNVLEWTNTIDRGSYRVILGGSWYVSEYSCGISIWSSVNPDVKYYDIGFRLVRTVRNTLLVTLSNIAIKTPATKVTYNIGENIDITGLVVTGTYSDGSTKTENITAGAITGFDSTTAGTKTLTVTVGGKTLTYQVTVKVIGNRILVLSGTTSAKNGSITLENDFYMGKYEVTQFEFQSMMGFNPSSFTGVKVGNNPVENVTWYDAVAYCNVKSAAEGLELYYNISGITKSGNNITAAIVTENTGAKGYRLPTTEEWEYAARGGKNGVGYTYSGSNTIGDVAWYSDNSLPTNSDVSDSVRGTHPVGGKVANDLGIYDMSGNVWEWTNTIDVESGRCIRGGSWDCTANYCTLSDRFYFTPNVLTCNAGFRTANNTAIATLLNITITTQAAKITYNMGENFDITGLIVTGTYSNGNTKTETITAGAITGFDSRTAGTKTLTITVNGKMVMYKVTINGIVPPVTVNMVLVPAGTTTANNGSIMVEKDFYIRKYEVTQADFQSVMGFNPSYFTGENLGNNPVEQVTWYDSVAYCNAKSTAEGLGLYYNISDIIKTKNNITSAMVTENVGAKGYRLPTTEEWEYAARGGKNGVGYTYSGSNNIEDVAWNSSNSGNKTHTVGGKSANELGIYDMSGNVWECTNTIYSGSSRIGRGGSCDDDENMYTFSVRGIFKPGLGYHILGFRPVRTK